MADQLGQTSERIELRKWKKSGGFDGAANVKTLDNSTLLRHIRASKKYTKNPEIDSATGRITEAEVTLETRRPYYELTTAMFFHVDDRILEIVEILPHPKLRNWIIIRTKRVFNHE